jgi:autotransporter passenger strand-loop-strand repeat protein
MDGQIIENEVISSGEEQTVLNGGKTINVTIASDGIQYVLGGTVIGTKINGIDG